MAAKDSQKTVEDFVNERGLSLDVQARLLDLQAEVGELAKEYLIASEYGRQEFEKTIDWEAEMGDVLFSLIALALASGVSLEQALDDALKKYRQRLASGDGIGSGK